MASSSNGASFGIAISLLITYLLALPNISIGVTDEQLRQICSNKKVDKQFCLSKLKSDPGTPAADIKGLALITIKLTSNYINVTVIPRILKLAESTKDPELHFYYARCNFYYGTALEMLRDASFNLRPDADLYYIRSQGVGCDVNAPPPNPPPFKEYSEELSRYTYVLEAVESLL